MRNTMKKTKKVFISILSIAAIAYSGCQSNPAEENYPTEVTVETIADTDGYSYVCRPAGKGTFPAVLYSHGGLGSATRLQTAYGWVFRCLSAEVLTRMDFAG